jgi:hypothetical protein
MYSLNISLTELMNNYNQLGKEMENAADISWVLMLLPV